ncbi:MAG: hypothetical protein ACNI28_10335 [Arcobacter sp.]|uniref:hypothetical protein n=1 Tax=Arcobacter sp. TaxID=1872629 RepID=UPI003B00F122
MFNKYVFKFDNKRFIKIIKYKIYNYDIEKNIIKPLYNSYVIIVEYIKLTQELEKNQFKFEIIEDYSIKIY